MLDTYTREHVGRLSLIEPIRIDRMATLREAAESLFVNDIGLLLVTDGSLPAGVISERDVVRALANGRDPDHTIVGVAMTGSLIAADVGDTLLDAAVQMVDANTRHIVVTENGEVRGVVSVRDLLPPILLQALGMRPSDDL
jgi:CBS domain-containing protein